MATGDRKQLLKHQLRGDEDLQTPTNLHPGQPAPRPTKAQRDHPILSQAIGWELHLKGGGWWFREGHFSAGDSISEADYREHLDETKPDRPHGAPCHLCGTERNAATSVSSAG